ncbi:ArsR/SmtB family transcription factor [Inquilinus sp.]|uniref:ArsR/SmtB family transcription factor n=1 Tax=Inquilinus sp. TaxID=1932117 RepID=UPI0037852027
MARIGSPFLTGSAAGSPGVKPHSPSASIILIYIINTDMNLELQCPALPKDDRAMDVPQRRLLTLMAGDGSEALEALASPVRLAMLRLLRQRGPLNVNQISSELALPQSTVAINVQKLERAELIRTEAVKASKGQQKVCSALYDEITVRLDDPDALQDDRVIEVAMPIGLYTTCEVSAPCGLCSTDGVLGLLDVPDHFLDPNRMKASLIWFGRGFVEYKFPNNAKVVEKAIEQLEVTMELSSEVPGTNSDWPSDITLWINHVAVATWTSPGDYGDIRGRYTPRWWKLAGSQYGKLVTWRVTDEGAFIDGNRASDVTLEQLRLNDHHAIRLRVGIDEKAEHPGGLNIFGRGFGNHDQDIVMRLRLRG